MKKLMVAIAGAVAIGFSAVAADWFNGGVAAGWPTAGAGLTGGAWDDDAADKGAWDSTKGEEGAVAVDAEASDPLKFTADDAKTIGETAKTVTISSTIKFTPFETLPAVPENAKAGVIVVKDPDDPTIFLYYVLAKDPNGTTNIWEDAGVGPDDNLPPANITVTIAADGAAVYNLDGAKYNTTIATDGTISAANYTGDGEIASLSATYELNVVTLKLPADPANVGSVIVSNVTDGVAVEKKDGVYTFPYGANAQVWIYAKEGYLFANGENFKKYDETMTENKDYSSETPENPTEAEAKIGTQYYLTLAEALNAADGNTVTLLKDAAVDALTFNKSFTFDVDGKIATFNGAVQVAAGAVALKNSKSKAPEMGTSEGGIVVNAPISVAADATLDLSLMPFGKDVYGGIDASIPAAYLDLASGSTAKFYYWGLATKEEVDTPNWMYGNLPYFFKNGAIPTGAIVVINGTEWTGDAEKGRFVIAGEIAIATVQGEHQIGEPVPTTFTFTESFATVADAFALTVADGTVTMVENSTEDGAAIGTSCALELNGKQFTVNGAIAVANGATVTLKNNTFDPSNPLAGGQGGFAPNGVITVADGATIDLSSLPFGTTYGGVQGTGSLTLASGATAKFYKWNVPMVDSANWMFYNYPAFFTGSQIPVGGIVWIGETKWTGTADHFALDNEVATATVKANHNVGGDMSEFYHVESFADLAAAITANVKDDVKLYAATELAAVTKAVSIDLNGSDLSLTGDTLANDLTVKGAAGKLIASGTKAVNANLDLGELDYATQLAGNTGAFAIAAGKTVTLPVAQAAWQLPAAMFAGTADGAKLVTQASSYTYGNGVWTEGEEIAVAKIGNVGYATLDAALEAAKAGDTVTLVANITTDATAAFKINKNLTLDFADYTVTKTVANDWTFDIANGATVVFDGNEGGVTQTQTAKNKDWPASMIRNKGNLTIKGGVYTSDFCIIKNDEDPGAGVLTVDGGTFNIVPAAEGMDDVQMALMNWATATINGGTWNGGVIASRSCDGNKVSKAGATEITAELDGTVKYMLMVGYPNDTTYANVPKMKGVDIKDVELTKVSTITDELELVEDGDWVTVQKKQSGPYTPETGGGTVEPTEIPGVYEVTPDPSSGIVTITGGLSETDTIIVTITNDFTIVGVPEDQIEIILNDIVVPNTAFVGGDENGFSTALNPDGDVDDVPVKPTLIEETEEEKPFVVGDSVETTVQAIPGLTYKLMRGDEPGAYPTQADKQSAGEGAATITLTDADKPADKAFYVIQVEK